MRFTPREAHKIIFRKEIASFISASERLQSMLAQGEHLSSDEAGVVRFWVVELLDKIPEAFFAEHHS